MLKLPFVTICLQIALATSQKFPWLSAELSSQSSIWSWKRRQFNSQPWPLDRHKSSLSDDPTADINAVLSSCKVLLDARDCLPQSPCGSGGNTTYNCSSVLSMDPDCGGGVNSPAIALWVSGNALNSALNGGNTRDKIRGLNLMAGGYKDCRPDFAISDDILWVCVRKQNLVVLTTN